MTQTISIAEIKSLLDGMQGAGVTGDYTPPSFQWYGSTTLYIPAGVYYKAGPRANQQYMDIDNFSRYWVVEDPIFWDIDVSEFDGTTGSGFLPNGKVASSWYGVWLIEGTDGKPTPVILPYVKITGIDNTTVSSTGFGIYPFPTTTNGLLDDYRIINYANYTWDISDQRITKIESYKYEDTPHGSLSGDTTYELPAMTSTNTPSPLVADQSSVSESSYGWMLFDRSAATKWHNGGATLPGWVSLDTGATTRFNKYRLQSRDSYDDWPRAWKIQGSNNNVDWSDLHTVVRAYHVNYGGNWSEWYTFKNENYYRYYRYYVTEGQDKSYISFKQLQFADTLGAYITTSGYNGAPYLGRYGAALAQSTSSCWLFAGIDQTDVYPIHDLWRFDFDTEELVKIDADGEGYCNRRAAMVYDATSNCLYAFGGYTVEGVTGTNLNVTFKCQLGDNNTAVWTKLSPGGSIPSIRSGEIYAFDSSRRRIYLYGGNTNDSYFYYYDIAANTWNLVSSSSTPGSRQSAQMIYDPINDCLLLYGGGTDMNSPLNTMYKYTISTNTWTAVTLSNPRPPGKWQHMMVYSNGYIYMVGGTEQYSLSTDSFWRFNIATSTFEELPRYNASTIRGGTIAATSSGVYVFNGYDDWGSNRTRENWKFVFSQNEWRRLDSSPEITENMPILFAPPENRPSLYLGSIYIQADGTIRKFLKEGWSYSWYSHGTDTSTTDYVIGGTRSTGFGNADISRTVPPTAYEVKVSIIAGHLAGSVNNVRMAFCSSDSGGSLATGFDCPMSNDRSNDNYRGTVNLCLTWYQQYGSSNQRFSQTVDYMLSCNQIIRNHFYTYNTVPDTGQFSIVGFLE